METTATPNSNPVRSTFLTVICVLTFIGSGWGIIGSIRSYAMADTISVAANGAIEAAQDKLENQDTPNFVKQIFSTVTAGLSADNIRKSAIFKLISCLLTLAGAIMMWNLKKTGFYLYIAGVVVLAITPIIILGGSLPGLVGAGGSGFIGVIFIVLYAVNLKDMR
jgi:hypothetical protein